MNLVSEIKINRFLNTLINNKQNTIKYVSSWDLLWQYNTVI
jgi:hypothetical protein